MSSLPLSALLQAAIRRRLLTRDQAQTVGQDLIGARDIPSLKQRLDALSCPEAPLLRELLPTPALPDVPGWRLFASLGQGRTSGAWLGAADNGSELVVIKLFHPQRLEPGQDVTVFLRDVERLIGIDHSYLVRYLGAGTASDGRAVLVQDFIAGSDLASRVSRHGQQDEAEALPLMRQVAKGLAELQHLRICHGLLHPGNILIDPDGRARLSDYGLAFGQTLQAVRSDWEPRALMLHAWSAPEALTQPPVIGAASDCYALGCIAYWLLSGRHPFPGAPDVQALQHLNAPRPDVRMFAPSVSEITAKTLAKAMQVQPTRRYRQAKTFAASLQRNLELLEQAVLQSAPVEQAVQPVHGPMRIATPLPEAAGASADSGSGRPRRHGPRQSDRIPVVKQPPLDLNE